MLNGKRILAVTLARGGSKGIPNKNITDLAGKPLIAYTIKECLLSSYIDRYVVSTDSARIADVAEHFGAEVPFLRSSETSSDTATSADALLEVVSMLEDMGYHYDIIVEVMATNPLKQARHIDACLELMREKKAPACVAVTRLFDQHPSRIKYLENGIMMDFYPEIPESRRQDLVPEAYIRAGSIYCVETKYLKDNKARYGKNDSIAYILDQEFVINIDEPSDLQLAEVIIKRREATNETEAAGCN